MIRLLPGPPPSLQSLLPTLSDIPGLRDDSPTDLANRLPDPAKVVFFRIGDTIKKGDLEYRVTGTGVKVDGARNEDYPYALIGVPYSFQVIEVDITNLTNKRLEVPEPIIRKANVEKG